MVTVAFDSVVLRTVLLILDLDSSLVVFGAFSFSLLAALRVVAVFLLCRLRLRLATLELRASSSKLGMMKVLWNDVLWLCFDFRILREPVELFTVENTLETESPGG